MGILPMRLAGVSPVVVYVFSFSSVVFAFSSQNKKEAKAKA